MKKYVCIHGHFYQPPRENPWLESIEVQDSAYPFRDWNERITAECYGPNTNARILSNNRTIIDIVNNYSKISFNFGPTLLSWLESEKPDVYEGIIEADRLSMQYFNGHGSAIAQVYNHIIMPIASRRDKETQVVWGIEDFKKRFGRDPEGIWLAETAVDIETLEILADHNIKFTILAPRQAKSVKHIKDNKWHDVSKGTVDPRRTYLCKLPSGKSINLFFYEGAISQELAFGDLLVNGENLANRLINMFDENEDVQLAHIATDGETYGHHHKQGDMALAYCLHHIETLENVELTVYGKFLEEYPAEYEAQIIENTSWSCIHGVERWKSNCGCSTGREGWNQEWRTPLLDALNWLRDTVNPYYESEMERIGYNPWEKRNEYIKIILNRDPDVVNSFLKDKNIKKLNNDDYVKILRLMEIERHTLLMYTSCGWFFDEISGIETVQVILYAARVIQLFNQVFGIDLETEFTEKLEHARSNIPEFKNGREVYERFVKPSIIDLIRVAAHYAVASLFDDPEDNNVLYSYEVHNEFFEKNSAGRNMLVIGRSKMRSRITADETTVSYSAIYLGEDKVYGGVRESLSNTEFNKMKDEIKKAFFDINLVDMILSLDKNFGTHSYSLWHLFKDKSREVFKILMKDTLDNIHFMYKQVYENNYSIIHRMKQLRLPLPATLISSLEFVLNNELHNMFDSDELLNLQRIRNIRDEIKKWDLNVDTSALSRAAENRVNLLMKMFNEDFTNLVLMHEARNTLQISNELELSLGTREAENSLFYVGKKCYENIDGLFTEAGQSEEWTELFKELENLLNVRIPKYDNTGVNIQNTV